MQVSWYAKTIDKKKIVRNYHLKLTNKIPLTKFQLLFLIDDVAKLAKMNYNIDQFILQCWKRPVSRKFKRIWMMEFDIDYTGSVLKIKAARFDTKNREIWQLKQDYSFGDGKRVPASREYIPTTLDLLSNAYPTPRRSLYSLRVPRSHRSSGYEKRIPSLYSMKLPEQISKPVWRRPLTKGWREGIRTRHQPR